MNVTLLIEGMTIIAILFLAVYVIDRWDRRR